MKYTSEFDSANNICRVYVAGTIHSPGDADELKQFARDFFAEHGCHRFLFDMKHADIAIGPIAMFDAGAPRGEMAHALRTFKVAVVVQDITEVLSFFEDVAVNRGFKVRVLADVDKAFEWLKPDTPPST